MIGRGPMVTIGFGTFSPSRMRRPSPPQNKTTFIAVPSPDHGFRALPAQLAVQPSRRHQFLDAIDSLVAGELLRRQPVPDESFIELVRAAPDVPLGAEPRNRARELAAIHAVAARIRPPAFE